MLSEDQSYLRNQLCGNEGARERPGSCGGDQLAWMSQGQVIGPQLVPVARTLELQETSGHGRTREHKRTQESNDEES